MEDVVIQRCTVHVIRRGGFSWGESPARLAELVQRRLPTLLAERLEAQLPEGAEGTLQQPVRLTLRLRLAELLEELPGGEGGARQTHAREVEAQLDRAVQRLVRSAIEDGTLVIPRAPAPHEDRAQPEVHDRVTAEDRWAGTLLKTLLAWQARGALRQLLDSFAPEVVDAWHGAIFPEAPRSAQAHAAAAVIERSTEASAVLAEQVRAIVSALVPERPQTAHARLRARLLVFIEALAGGSAPGTLDGLRRAVELHLPPLAGTTPSGALQAPVARRELAPGAPGAPPVLLQPVQPRALPLAAAGEVRVRSALPFLLLGPLSRTGWLDALPAVLVPLGLADRLAEVATALAYKVLAPPERSWRRTPEARSSAAAFAGLAHPADDAALSSLAERSPTLLSPLDALLESALLAGRTAGSPLILVHSAGRVHLIESEGSAPLGSADTIDDLQAALGRCRDAIVLVPRAAAAPPVLAALQRAGRSFVTDAAPARGEDLVRLGRGSRGLFTNDRSRPRQELLAAADDLAARAQLALDSLAAMDERRAAPLSAAPGLERSLGHAALTSLSTLAWRLFHEWETPHPLLALQRFESLDAVVRFSPGEVTVRLPLGQRFQDLLQCGLASTVHDVPWLSGRPVRITGG